MTQKKRHNHFVSQMYLRNWGDGKNHIWSYRLLVPNGRYPLWENQPIGGVAYQRDLYTVMSGGLEDDSFERWIESEYETPVRGSLAKVILNKKLTAIDWERLALFLAVQDLRTPLNYIESTQRWEQFLPEALEKVLNDTIQILEEHHRDGKPLPEKKAGTQLFNDLLNVSITPHKFPEQKMGEIRAEIAAGRKLWIESQRHLLTNTSRVLLKHKWSIAEPAKGMTWFTSDQPVVRLNYYEGGKYDLKGGWDRKGTDLIMPLSPFHLLFTQVGSEHPDRFRFSIDQTYWIQKALAERAFRRIFAQKELPGVVRLRPRNIDLEQFSYEQKQWENWHREQSLFER